MPVSPATMSEADAVDQRRWVAGGRLRWPFLAFEREDIATGVEPAACSTQQGVLWEYDGERFLRSDIISGVFREPAACTADVPPGPWRHLPGCVCEACRLGVV